MSASKVLLSTDPDDGLSIDWCKATACPCESPMLGSLHLSAQAPLVGGQAPDFSATAVFDQVQCQLSEN